MKISLVPSYFLIFLDTQQCGCAEVVQGMQMIRKLGTFVEFSVFAQPTTLDWSIIGDRKELALAYGCLVSDHSTWS